MACISRLLLGEYAYIKLICLGKGLATPWAYVTDGSRCCWSLALSWLCA